jgi:uncharacterized protein (DUF1810 family)
MQCINDWFEHCSKKQQQWCWFIFLWCAGLGTAMFLGFAIRSIMGIE